MRARKSGRPAHSRSSRAARSAGSAVAMAAANRSSSFMGLALRLTQRKPPAKGAVEPQKPPFVPANGGRIENPVIVWEVEEKDRTPVRWPLTAKLATGFEPPQHNSA